MDTENVFAWLRRLAVKVEKETQNPNPNPNPEKILKEMQYDVHKLKGEITKEVKRQEETNSFKDILTACDNLLRIRQQQANALKAHLIQYGYQPRVQEQKQAKTKKSTSDDKENEDTSSESLSDSLCGNNKPSSQGSGTPPRQEGATRDLDRTPKEEDFGLCPVSTLFKKEVPSSSLKQQDTSNSAAVSAMPLMQEGAMRDVSRTPQEEDFGLCSVNVFPKKDIPPPLRKQGIANSGLPAFETTVVYQQNSGDQNWEDLTNNFTQRNTALAPRPNSAEPTSPNLSTWYLQDQSKRKPPVQPVMLLQQGEDTFTPPSPECQATEMLNVMPQEPRRLVDAMDQPPPPQEPKQCWNEGRGRTLAPSVTRLGYPGGQLLSQKPAATPVYQRGSALPAFLQDDGTPRTPELTMSISHLGIQPKAPVFAAPTEKMGNASYQPTSVATPQNVLHQSVKNLEPERTHTIIAPITSDEYRQLTEKLRNRISLEQVNKWIQIVDDYMKSKPLDQQHLSPDDISSMRSTHPWLKALLIYLVNFNRLEKMQSENGEIFYMPFMRRKIDFS